MSNKKDFEKVLKEDFVIDVTAPDESASDKSALDKTVIEFFKSVSELKDIGVQVNITEPAKVYYIHRFNGQNYHWWQQQMLIYMKENKLKPYILGEMARPATGSTEAWDQKDAEAQAFLMRGLELEQLKYLSDCTTAAQIWARLETVHSQRSEQSVQILLDKFINGKMEEGESMSDFIAKIVAYAQRLKDMKQPQQDVVIITKILGSLPPKFDNIRMAWYAIPKEQQTVEKLRDFLLNEEALIKGRTENSEGQSSEGAFFARGKRYFQNRNRGSHDKNKNEGQSERETGERDRNPRRKGKCNYCGLSGHWERECRIKKRAEENRKKYKNKNSQFFASAEENDNASRGSDSNDNQDNRAQGNMNHYSYSDRACLFTADCFATSQNRMFDPWYADSGASEHMSHRRDRKSVV